MYKSEFPMYKNLDLLVYNISDIYFIMMPLCFGTALDSVKNIYW